MTATVDIKDLMLSLTEVNDFLASIDALGSIERTNKARKMMEVISNVNVQLSQINVRPGRVIEATMVTLDSTTSICWSIIFSAFMNSGKDEEQAKNMADKIIAHLSNNYKEKVTKQFLKG